MMETQVLCVGQPFPAQLSGPTYIWNGSAHFLAIAMPHVSAAELASFHCGVAEFGLYEDGPVGVLLYSFGTALPVSDAAFHLWSGGRLDREAADAMLRVRFNAAEDRIGVNLVLIDSTKNAIVGMRRCSFSPSFSRAFVDLLQRQIRSGPISDPEFRDRVEAIYNRFPTSEKLWAQNVQRCHGGG